MTGLGRAEDDARFAADPRHVDAARLQRSAAGRLRILMAGPLPPAVGGMASVLRNLCDSRIGRECAVATFDTAKTTPQRRSFATALCARVTLWRRWWRALDVPRTLVHIHTCSGLSFFLDGALLLLARLRGAPVLLHVHGGQFDRFLDELDPLRRAAARWLARRAARVVVLSDSWRQRLQPRLPGASLEVVENGVPPGAMPDRGGAAREPLVMFLGGLCAAKGVEELLRAVAAQPVRPRIALIGPEAEGGFVARMRTLATELGVADCLAMPGAADDAGKAAWFGRATIFALPSHGEGLPIALLEAMAAGLPVVTTPVGAIPTVIDDGCNGLLVAVHDVDALAAALARLLADVDLRERLGARARADCSARFGIERAADRFLAIYGQIAMRHAGVRA